MAYKCKKGPGVKTFNALVGMMVVGMIAFVILFIACLVVMATLPAYKLSSGHSGRFSVITGMDGIRAAIAPQVHYFGLMFREYKWTKGKEPMQSS